ncbi:hypothetical protein LWI28_005930 [Acer negundo]|uniref:Uncharacterized protein n=1 Tax=Acer negundo TaxID=4023 RepID=A0AAD5JCI6_ACENE|nr:hypothetical protein LWI28_005930 [Acer negundo]
MVEAIGLEVVDKAYIEPTNLVVEEIDKTTESNIFEDLVTIPLALVGQSVGKLDIGFEDTNVRLGLVDVDFVWYGFEVKKDLVGFISTLDPFHIYFVGKPPNSMIVDMDGFETKGTSLLYGAEDPSIAGMVLDSPFSDLVELMMEFVDTYKFDYPSSL